MRRMLFAMVAVLVVAVPAFAAECEKGEIDWNSGFIIVKGMGTAPPSMQKAKARVMAFRAAEVSAQRSLLETIKGVRITSRTTVAESMVTEDVIKTRVDGIVKGAIVTKRDYEEVDGALMATVEMKICMNAGPAECASKPTLVNALSLETRPVPVYVPVKTLNEAPIPAPAVAEPPPPPTGGYRPPVYDSTKPVTGIVLNLDGRYFERELLPVVITNISGENVTVYSVKIVNPSVVRTYGAIRYADTLDTAKKEKAVGENPMVITVDTVTKENMIMIRSSDARLLKETGSHGNNYLSEAKVIISSR